MHVPLSCPGTTVWSQMRDVGMPAPGRVMEYVMRLPGVGVATHVASEPPGAKYAAPYGENDAPSAPPPGGGTSGTSKPGPEAPPVSASRASGVRYSRTYSGWVGHGAAAVPPAAAAATVTSSVVVLAVSELPGEPVPPGVPPDVPPGEAAEAAKQAPGPPTSDAEAANAALPSTVSLTTNGGGAERTTTYSGCDDGKSPPPPPPLLLVDDTLTPRSAMSAATGSASGASPEPPVSEPGVVSAGAGSVNCRMTVDPGGSVTLTVTKGLVSEPGSTSVGPMGRSGLETLTGRSEGGHEERSSGGTGTETEVKVPQEGAEEGAEAGEVQAALSAADTCWVG